MCLSHAFSVASSSFIFNVLLNNIKKFGVREWSGCELKETLNSFVSKETVMIGIYIYIYIFLICFCFWIFSTLHPMCLGHAFLVASSSFIFNVLLNNKYLIIKSDFVCLILRCFTLTIFCRAFVPISQKFWLQQNLEMFVVHFPFLFWPMH